MISAVVTSYNDAKIVPELTRRLKIVLEKNSPDFEIIFVDDGSRDSSVEIIEKEHESDGRVKLIELSRNFGQPFAIRAGMHHAKGDVVIIMDGDLQDLPEEIPKLLKPLSEGFDLVYAKRNNRQHNWYRRLGSRLLIKILSFSVKDIYFQKGYEVMLVGVFRAMNRSVVDALCSLPEHTAYIQALIRWVGFRQTLVDVEHGKRFAGTSKYSMRKLIKYALDGVISFSPYPLRLASYVGFCVTVLAFFASLGYFLQRIWYGTHLVGFTSLMLVMLFFGGIQLLMIGILGEYLARMYEEVKQRPLYVVRRKLL